MVVKRKPLVAFVVAAPIKAKIEQRARELGVSTSEMVRMIVLANVGGIHDR